MAIGFLNLVLGKQPDERRLFAGVTGEDDSGAMSKEAGSAAI